METNSHISAPHLCSPSCFTWNFKALGLIWKNIPLIQILMSAFTQGDSFSRTVHNVGSFWSLTLSTNLVYSHLLPPSQSLFSSLPCLAIAGELWSWDQVLPTMSIHHRKAAGLLPNPCWAGMQHSHWICGLVCQRYVASFSMTKIPSYS